MLRIMKGIKKKLSCPTIKYDHPVKVISEFKREFLKVFFK
jgi:hypothetical protein